MSQLGFIIRNEYFTDIKSKSFWISTFLVPLILVAFGAFGGFMMANSDTAMGLEDSMMSNDGEDMTPLKIIGLMMGLVLTLFLMTYGAQIFQKVKIEKTNRIVEILATCVPGRTMMLAKILAVGLVGFTQILLWGLLIGVFVIGILIVFPIDIPWNEILTYDYIMAVVWSILYFIGGYVLFGSLYAAVGAMTDKNNENQEYMTVLTFLLLFCYYIGMYAVDNGGTIFVRIMSFIPFTSPTIGAVNAITQSVPLWETILSIVILYVCAWFAMVFAGKIYTSSIMLKGKKFSPKDIITFIKAK